MANGRPVGFGYRLPPDDRVEVFGLDRTAEPAADSRPKRQPNGGSRPDPGRCPIPPRFVLDGHLGRLARYLRMLGFDTRYDNRAADDELARLSADENRILLTRDRGLLKRSVVRLGYLVRDDDPRRQLGEVCRSYGLAPLGGAVQPLRPL